MKKLKELCYFCVGKNIGPCADAYTELCGIFNTQISPTFNKSRIIICDTDEEFLKSINSHKIEDEYNE